MIGRSTIHVHVREGHVREALSDDPPLVAAVLRGGGRLLVATDATGEAVGSMLTIRPGSGPLHPGGPGEGGALGLTVAPGQESGQARDDVVSALIGRCLADARHDRLDRVVLLWSPPSGARAARDRAVFAALRLHRQPWRDRRSADGSELVALVVGLAPVTLRQAKDDDLEAVGQLTVAGYLADRLVEPRSGYVRHLADAADRATNATLLVALDAGGVVGTVTWCRPGSPYAELSGPGESEFRMLAVDPVARGAGIGAALVHACLDLAGEAGDRAIVLSTLATMRAAGRLYRRLGFVADPARNWSPLPGVDLLAFRRDVVPPPG